MPGIEGVGDAFGVLERLVERQMLEFLEARISLGHLLVYRGLNLLVGTHRGDEFPVVCERPDFPIFFAKLKLLAKGHGKALEELDVGNALEQRIDSGSRNRHMSPIGAPYIGLRPRADRKQNIRKGRCGPVGETIVDHDEVDLLEGLGCLRLVSARRGEITVRHVDAISIRIALVEDVVLLPDSRRFSLSSLNKGLDALRGRRHSEGLGPMVEQVAGVS